MASSVSWLRSQPQDHGRGRALDNIFVERLWRNVKREDVYLRAYANMAEPVVGLAQYFAFYNAERPHQSVGYQTPISVYRSGIGGGALNIDKYGLPKRWSWKRVKATAGGAPRRMIPTSGKEVALRGSADQLLRWKRRQLKLADNCLDQLIQFSGAVAFPVICSG